MHRYRCVLIEISMEIRMAIFFEDNKGVLCNAGGEFHFSAHQIF